MARKSMQGTPWHVVNGWQLKEKDEFAWEVIEKKKNNNINHDKQKKRNEPKGKRNYEGNFVLKFEGENPTKYVIGDNISKEAEIIKMVYQANVGEKLSINGEKVVVLAKNIK